MKGTKRRSFHEAVDPQFCWMKKWRALQGDLPLTNMMKRFSFSRPIILIWQNWDNFQRRRQRSFVPVIDAIDVLVHNLKLKLVISPWRLGQHFHLCPVRHLHHAVQRLCARLPGPDGHLRGQPPGLSYVSLSSRWDNIIFSHFLLIQMDFVSSVVVCLYSFSYISACDC